MNDLKIIAYIELPEDAVEIRKEVFVEEQGFIEEFDVDDNDAVHLVAFIGEKPVASCRIITKDKQNYMIGRIAVRKEHRKKGIGAEIVKAAETVITQWKIHYKLGDTVSVYIHSQMQAGPFYEKIGYISTGKTDYEQDCPHLMLKKEI